MSKFIPNSFQVPNAIVDEWLGDMSDSALRSYIIITRKTRGWNKDCDRISLSQFKKLGKKSVNTIRNGLAELVEMGLVIKHETAAGDVWELNDAVSKSDIANSDTVSKSDTELYQNLIVGVSKSDNTEIHYIKTTNKKTHSPSEPTPDYPDFENKTDDRFKNFDGLGYKTIPDHWKQTALAKYPELNEQSLNDLFNGIEAHYQPQTGRKHTDAQWNGHWGKWLANNASMAIRKQPKAQALSTYQPNQSKDRIVPPEERLPNVVYSADGRPLYTKADTSLPQGSRSNIALLH